MATVIDQSPVPGRQRETLADDLLRLGVPEASVAQVEALVYREGMRLGAEGIRFIMRQLGATPAGRALERAILGADRSLEADAVEVGTSKQALHTATERIKRRLKKPG